MFPQLKKTMKGRRFDYVEKIQANATRQLRVIKKVTNKGAFVSGRNPGTSAYKHKDTTLKETGPTSLLVCSFTHKYQSGIKWSAHVFFA